MINVYNNIPQVYYKESRDFQLLGRVYEGLFNYIKMNVDNMTNNPCSENIDEKLIDLLTSTVGFESKHNYDVNDLMTLCASFNSILKDKGNQTSIENAIKLLLKAQNITKKFKVVLDKSTCTISVYIPSELQDIILLKDVFEYILPCGWTYNMLKGTVVENPTTNVSYVDKITSSVHKSFNANRVTDYGNNTEKTNTTTGIVYIGSVYGNDTDVEKKEE